VLDVDGGEHVDAGVKQFVDVLPAFRVAGAGDVGVGEFVDDGDLGLPGQHRLEVHLGELGAAVGDRRAGQHLEVADHRLGVFAAVGFDECDNHVGAAFGAAVRFLEHGVGLADAGGGAEVDA
jgi:hypothetical protein